MNERAERAVALVRAVHDAGKRVDAAFLAAAVAYYAFVSLVPLTLLSFVVGSAVGGGALTEAAQRAAAGLLAPQGQALLADALEGEAGRGGATLFGLGVLLWSSLRVFRGLDRAFSRVYGSGPQPLSGQVRDAVIVLVVTASGLVAMTLVTTLVALLPVVSVLRGMGVAVLWATLLVAFVPLYTVFPNADVDVRQALPGAALAATAFVALGSLFGVYTSVAGNYALYGVLGAVLLVVTWLYLGSLAVMYGAVLNAVLVEEVAEPRSDST